LRPSARARWKPPPRWAPARWTAFSPWLCLARPGFITAAILSFAHTVGEFGVVLMLGGNIPGVTRVVSVQIYDHVEALEYAQAHWLAGGMVLFSFVVLLCLNLAAPSSAIS
jgi:molybdate transport system permease protein